MTTTPPGDEPEPTPGTDGPAGPATTQEGPRREGPHDDGPRVGAAEVRDLGRMRRTVGPDRYVAGVGGGLARHLDVDPVVIRVALAVLAFFGGAGLLIYAVAWLVVPEDGADRARLSMDHRSRTVALAGTGVLAGLALLGDTLGGNWFPWPLALLALVVFLVVTRRDRRAAPPGAAMQPDGSPAGSPAPGSPAPSAATTGTPTAPYATHGWTPPPPPRPRNPRRRGPRLFPATLAAIALAIGLVGLVDVAGLSVADVAYPAVALGVTTAVLLLSSVWGRGGGLIALGLLCAIALGATSAASEIDGGSTVYRPEAASEVRDSYDIGVGEIRLDLTDVADPEALDGRTIDLRAGFGAIEVVLPDDVDAVASARADGPGGLTLFGQDSGGVDTRATAEHDGGVDAPRLSIDAEVGAGEIVVRTP